MYEIQKIIITLNILHMGKLGIRLLARIMRESVIQMC